MTLIGEQGGAHPAPFGPGAGENNRDGKRVVESPGQPSTQGVLLNEFLAPDECCGACGRLLEPNERHECDLASEVVTAAPYTARQCPVCKLWVYVADGPFAENDMTKTEADYLHWRDLHQTEDDAIAPNVIGFPFFTYNDVTVEAVKEYRRP